MYREGYEDDPVYMYYGALQVLAPENYIASKKTG